MLNVRPRFSFSASLARQQPVGAGNWSEKEYEQGCALSLSLATHVVEKIEYYV